MDQDLTRIKSIGPARLKSLKAAGISTIDQLLCRLPVDYLDLTEVTPIGNLRAGERFAVEAYVSGSVSAGYYRGLHITRCRLTDSTGTIETIWYNQPWLKNRLMSSDGPFLLYGKTEPSRSGVRLVCPTFEVERSITPVYAPIAGIPPKTYRQMIESALQLDDGQRPDELPEPLRRRHELCERNFALRAAHFPQSREALEIARRRIAFEELLLFQTALFLMRGNTQKGVTIPCKEGATSEFWRMLGFAPTNAQKRVLEEIRKDLNAPSAMARLVQGDVGCGKTAVAFGALYLCAKSGFQGAMMAPTEVLARQHYESACALLGKMGISVGLLTGSLTAKQRRMAHENIESGAWQVIIGTHALISESITYHNLGLVVTDEQHRFGVRQRTALSQKGDAPNVLVMSATPIPRTLSLILYGDLDVSVIDELPPGRTPVRTRIVPESKRAGMYEFIRTQAAQGGQTYIVCPLVEESEAIEAQPAEKVYEELVKGPLSSLRVGLAHGRMKTENLAETLNDFSTGKIQVLVATTVVEVGVNVPAATVMVIESAERFGLAQLHQLRGRVGRGAREAWCFLMAEPNERLKLLTQTTDGFLIARKDMEFRGPGEILGTRQSGLGLGMLGKTGADVQLLQESGQEARAQLRGDYPEEAPQVIALARRMLKEKMQDVAMN